MSKCPDEVDLSLRRNDSDSGDVDGYYLKQKANPQLLTLKLARC